MTQPFKIRIKNGQKYFYRLTLNQRLQHIVLAVSVMLLVLTGMPLRFHDAAWATPLYAIFGGIEFAPIVHRIAGSALLALFVYHLFYLAYYIIRDDLLPLYKRGELTAINFLKVMLTQPMIPNLKDARDLLELFKYLFFLTGDRPKGAKWTWKEKYDYWAPFWGMLIIGTSGLILWNKSVFSWFFSGQLINYAIIAHSDEALLAALFLFIWHWYNVHFSVSVFPMGMAFINGYLTEELMIEEHYEHYVEVMKECGYGSEIKPPHGHHSEPKPDPKAESKPVPEAEQNGGPAI
jgi:cytochrome b subunit of formate dehydrogenase